MAAEEKTPGRASHQLPPGRHKLSRSYVEANQRKRIVDAIIEVSSLAGYSAMSVEEIIGTAGVSRRTFYDHFRSKEEAFLAALETVSDQLLERVRSAYGAAESFPAAVRDGLAAFLRFLASQPSYADFLIVEVLAAGPAAISRRNHVMDAFAALIRRGAQDLPAGRRPPDLAAETIVGGIYEVVFSRVLQGQTADLPKLLPDLSYSLMQPYLGHEAARRESAEPPQLPADDAFAA